MWPFKRPWKPVLTQSVCIPSLDGAVGVVAGTRKNEYLVEWPSVLGDGVMVRGWFVAGDLSDTAWTPTGREESP